MPCMSCEYHRNSAVPVEYHMYQRMLRSRPESICVLYGTILFTSVPITSQKTASTESTEREEEASGNEENEDTAADSQAVKPSLVKRRHTR
jgi:hypothetical protein